jgi:hypothetical protein
MEIEILFLKKLNFITHPYSTQANFEGTKPSTTPTNTVKYPILGD